MIVNEIFHAVKCNRCSEIFDSGEIAYWSDEDTAVENALESDWIEINNKHYCPDCYDEVEGEDVIREDYPEHVKKLRQFFDKIIMGSISIFEYEDYFMFKHRLYNSTQLNGYDEDYILNRFGDKIISIGYEKNEGYNIIECIIKIRN